MQAFSLHFSDGIIWSDGGTITDRAHDRLTIYRPGEGTSMQSAIIWSD